MRGLQLYINSKFIIMLACVRLYIRTFDMVQIPFITNLRYSYLHPGTVLTD